MEIGRAEESARRSKPAQEDDRFRDGELVIGTDLIFPEEIPRCPLLLLLSGCGEVQLTLLARISTSGPDRKAERPADQRTGVIHKAKPLFIEVRAGHRLSRAEKLRFLPLGEVPEIWVGGGLHDEARSLLDAGTDPRLELIERVSKHRHIRRRDLEESVTAHGAATAAEKVGWLLSSDLSEVLIGAIEDAFVGVAQASRATAEGPSLLPLAG